jgi:8-oxo-dGTP diphosphatase
MNDSDRSKFPHAILAVDVAVIAVIGGVPHVLLMPVQLPAGAVNRRKRPKDGPAPHGLPGGLVRSDETAEDAVERLLEKKCDLYKVFSEQLATFSGVNRDPTGRVVSVAYLALVPEKIAAKPTLPAGLVWRPWAKVGTLAYDHNAIVTAAIGRLRGKLQYTTIALHLLPDLFTLSELQNVYEGVLGRALDKRNFRKKLIDSNVVKGTGQTQRLTAGRPSELYRFADPSVQVIGILSNP